MIKKMIRLTTGLLLSGVLLNYAHGASPPSQAQAPTLKINGYTSMVASMANQQNRQNGVGGSDPYLTIGVSDLYFTITGRSSNGLEYLYRINFETVPGASFYVNRNYIQFNDKFGTIQIGDLKGPEDSMPESAMNLVNGAGGIDGTLGSVYNFSAGVISGVDFIGATGKSTKFVFTSPMVMGFQLGFAFTPNTSHIGKEGRNNASLNGAPGAGNSKGIYPDKANMPYGTRNIVLGLSYSDSADKWSWNFAVVGVTEKSHLVLSGSQQQFPVRNANSYQLSAAVGYDAWRVAAGWIDNRKSRLPSSLITTAVGSNNAGINLANTYLGNAGTAWNVGGSYTVGAYQFVTSYFRTDRKTDATNKASSDIVTATVDLSALQGLKFFGEVDVVKTRTNASAVTLQQNFFTAAQKGQTAIGNNSATVFMVGSKVSF